MILGILIVIGWNLKAALIYIALMRKDAEHLGIETIWDSSTKNSLFRFVP